MLVQSEVGDPSFLLGRLYLKGNWFYFPVAAAIKYTLPVLLMTLISLLSWRFWRGKSRELLFLVLPGVDISRVQHELKAEYWQPAPAARPSSPQRFLRLRGPGVGFAIAGGQSRLVAAILAFQIFTSLHAYPTISATATSFGADRVRRIVSSPTPMLTGAKPRRWLAITLRRRIHSNCFFLRTYNSENRDYGIPCGGISEIQSDPLQTPFTGTMIVSSTVVDGVGLGRMSVPVRRVFKDLNPVAKIGGSALLVYKGTFDVSPMVAFQLLSHARGVGEQDPQLALELGQRAAKLDPSDADAHVVMCGSYRALGQLEKAQQECNLGLALIRKDPQYGPEQIKFLENFITRNGLKIDDSATVAR